MSNILNMATVNAATDAALANAAAAGKEALAAAALRPYAERILELTTAGADTMEVRREAFIEVAVGWFIGLRHAKRDKTFKRGASDGAIALVVEKATLMAEGPTASKEAKVAANKHFNDDQRKTWASVSAGVARILKAANIETPNPRAKKGASGATNQAEATAEATETTDAPAPVKVAFSAANVKEPDLSEGMAAVVAFALEYDALAIHTHNACAGDLTGDDGAALRAWFKAVRDAGAKLRKAREANEAK